MRRLLSLFGAAALSACTPLGEQIGEGQSAFIGYRTLCQGSVAIRHDGQLHSRVDLGAGPQTLEVVGESAPEPSDEYPGDPNYACAYISTNRVSFLSHPRKIYRLHLSESEGNSIGVYEAVDEWGIETAPIETSSKQIAVYRRCGFFATGCDVGPAF